MAYEILNPEELGEPPGALRIGWFTHNTHTPPEPHPEATAAIEATTKLLASLGHRVEDAHPAALEQIPFAVRHLSGPYFFLPSLRKMYSPL